MKASHIMAARVLNPPLRDQEGQQYSYQSMAAGPVRECQNPDFRKKGCARKWWL